MVMFRAPVRMKGSISSGIASLCRSGLVEYEFKLNSASGSRQFIFSETLCNDADVNWDQPF